jgi:hypothetical protein
VSCIPTSWHTQGMVSTDVLPLRVAQLDSWLLDSALADALQENLRSAVQAFLVSELLPLAGKGQKMAGQCMCMCAA